MAKGIKQNTFDWNEGVLKITSPEGLEEDMNFKGFFNPNAFETYSITLKEIIEKGIQRIVTTVNVKEMKEMTFAEKLDVFNEQKERLFANILSESKGGKEKDIDKFGKQWPEMSKSERAVMKKYMPEKAGLWKTLDEQYPLKK